MNKTADFLHRIGLTEKEALAYETLLNQGALSVAELSSLTGCKRGDLYNILKSLKEKSLIEQQEGAGKAIFRTTDPYSLYGQIEAQKSSLEEADVLANLLLPQLVSRYNLATGKPAVRYFEGIPGLRRVYEELFASGTEEFLLMRSIFDNASPEMAVFTNEIVAEQIRRRIRVRLIGPLEAKSRRRFTQTDAERGIERRIVEPDKLLLPAEILVWKDTVALLSLRDNPIATLIENAGIAETFRSMFEYMWEKAEPYHDETVSEWE